jgi:hypothetical protein
METITVGKLRLVQHPDGRLEALHDLMRVSLPIKPAALERWLLKMFREQLTAGADERPV